MDDAIKHITGASAAFLLPPNGSYNEQVRVAAAVRGQSIVTWDFDSGAPAGSYPEP